MPLPLSAILPDLKTGRTGQKIPENDTEKIQFSRPIRDTHGNGRRSVPMPRMSNKRQLEWSFFLNHRNRITYNDLCRGCTHDCKQSFRAVIILCHRYYSKRWKPKEDTAYGR